MTCRIKAEVEMHEGVAGRGGHCLLFPLLGQHICWNQLHSVPYRCIAHYCLPCMHAAVSLLDMHIMSSQKECNFEDRGVLLSAMQEESLAAALC